MSHNSDSPEKLENPAETKIRLAREFRLLQKSGAEWQRNFQLSSRCAELSEFFRQAEKTVAASGEFEKATALAEFLRNLPEKKSATVPKIKDAEKSILPAVSGQQEFIEKLLSGSQKKTAFAIRMNAEKMCRDGGINSIGFLTLTVGDMDGNGKFQGVSDAAEASRRIDNLRRRVLPEFFEKAIVVTERHKSGKIHFHILGILLGRPDIRTNFDFLNFHKALDARKAGWINNAAEIRYKMSASAELRALWEKLREVLPKYGFGRAQLTPVEKTGEAIATYVSKYIEKNVCNRLDDDKRKKLVRYHGWNKQQLKPNEFEWNTDGAKCWRGKIRDMVALLGAEIRDMDLSLLDNSPEHVTEFCFMAFGKIRQKMFNGAAAKKVLGSRWAYHCSKVLERIEQPKTPFMVWDFGMMTVLRNELFRYAEKGHCRALNFPGVSVCGERFSLAEWKNYCEPFLN